jgi:hypothetical protein
MDSHLMAKKFKAFTILETILSVVFVVAVVLFGNRLIVIAEDNTQTLEESKIIDKKLKSLLITLREDIGAMVLLDKHQPIFEICGKSSGKSFQMFFFTTNGEKHTTAAIRYDISELEFGKMEIARTELDGQTTLELQMALSSGSSFESFFENVDQSKKLTREFDIVLSDFRVRVAVRGNNDRVILLPSNVKMLYTPRKIAYEKSAKWTTISGDILCFDVTARSLLKKDAAKLTALKAKSPDEAKNFLFLHSVKSFGKITFNASNF